MGSRLLVLAFFSVMLSAAAFAALPSVTSISHPEGKWSDDKTPSFKVTYSGADGYSYSLDDSESAVPDTTIDGEYNKSPATIILGGKQDGTYWFHVRAHSSAGWSDTLHYKIMIDTSGPSRPVTPTATAQPDGAVLVEWGAAEDSGSGIDYYNVYRSTLRFVKDGELSREFSINDAVAKLVGRNITGTSFTDKNFLVGEGFRFHYKIQPLDKAGNSGVISSVASVKTLSFCDNEIGISADKNGQGISISVESDLNFLKGRLMVTGPSGRPEEAAKSTVKVNSLSVNYSLSGKPNGDYNVFFSAVDNDGDECTVSTIFVFDTIVPKVKSISPATSSDLNGVVSLSVDAADTGDGASGISKVTLILVKGDSETIIGEAQLKEGNYVLDWNTINYDNGRFKVIARTVDRGGNKAEASATYSIKNTFYARANAEAAIAGAEAKRKPAVEYIADLQAKGIDANALSSILAAADANVISAKQSLETGGDSLATAEATAKSASAAYASILAKITVKNFSSAAYGYTSGQFEVFLGSSGMVPALQSEAKSFAKKLSPKRRLDIIEVKQDSNTYYVAAVTISFKNTDSNRAAFKIVEPIPKQFSGDAAGISANVPFEILKQDPNLLFGPFDLNRNASKSVVYRIAKPLTRQQANKLVSAKALDYYSAPPLALPLQADVSAFRGSPLSGIAASIPSVELNSDNALLVAVGGLMIFGILFLLAIVLVAAIYFFFIRKKGR